MAIRINQAHNFKGKAYVAADELDNLIQSLTFSGATRSSTENTWLLDFTPADSGTADTVAVDLTAIKDYIDNKAINVTAGAGIAINTSNALNPKISADVDGTTIVLSGTGDNAVLKADLKIKKAQNPTTGYAASYYLAYGDSTTAIDGVYIDIVKDQFIKSATFGWSTASDATGAGWTTTKSDSAKYPCIKIEVWTNIDGTDDSSSQGAVQDLFIPLADVFEEYKAGNGIEITASNAIQAKLGNGLEFVGSAIAVKDGGRVSVGANGVDVEVGNGIDASNTGAVAVSAGNRISVTNGVAVEVGKGIDANVTTAVEVKAGNRVEVSASGVSVKVGEGIDASNTTAVAVKVDAASEEVYAGTAGTTAAVLSVSTDGVKVANIQAAIDLAVNDEHSVAATAISAVDSKVVKLSSDANAAVTALNTRIETVAANAQTAANALETEIVAVDDKVETAVSTLNTNIEAAVDAIETSVKAHTTNAVQMIETTSALTATSGVVTVTVASANNIIAVYDPNGVQVYPQISRAGAAKPYTYTLTAEYGSATVDSSWTILYTKDLAAYTTVDAGDVTYAVTDSAVKTVASGTAATAPATASATEVADLSYKG